MHNETSCDVTNPNRNITHIYDITDAKLYCIATMEMQNVGAYKQRTFE